MIKKVILLINRRILQCTAFLFLGIVMGSVYVNTLYGERIDLLMFENRNASEELEMVREELEEVKKNLSQKDRRDVATVEIFTAAEGENLNDLERETIQMEISKQAKKMLEALKGQSLRDLDYWLIPQVLDERVLEAGGKMFTLKTEILVIDEKIIIHLRASPVNKKEE